MNWQGISSQRLHKKTGTYSLFCFKTHINVHHFISRGEYPNKKILVIDRLIFGELDDAQRKYVLQMKGYEDNVDNLIDFASSMNL